MHPHQRTIREGDFDKEAQGAAIARNGYLHYLHFTASTLQQTNIQSQKSDSVQHIGHSHKCGSKAGFAFRILHNISVESTQ